MTDKLPDVLQGLVAAERAAPVMTEAARAAVQAKLGATLGIATTTTATATTASGAATTTTTATATATTAATATVGAVKVGTILKLVTVLVVVGGATTAAISTSRSSAPRAAAPVITEAATPVERMPAPAPAYEVMPDAPAIIEEPATAPAAAPPAPKAAAPKPAPAPEVPTQAVLLADASRAFASGDARRALQILDEDARHRTDGPLAEERDALRVSVLVEGGRLEEARQHARELLARYPQSIHRPLVERVLTKDSP